MVDQKLRTSEKGRSLWAGSIGTVVVILKSDVASLKDDMGGSVCSWNDGLDRCISTPD